MAPGSGISPCAAVEVNESPEQRGAPQTVSRDRRSASPLQRFLTEISGKDFALCLAVADSRPHRYLCQSLGLCTVGSVEESAERISLVSYGVGRLRWYGAWSSSCICKYSLVVTANTPTHIRFAGFSGYAVPADLVSGASAPHSFSTDRPCCHPSRAPWCCVAGQYTGALLRALPRHLRLRQHLESVLPLTAVGQHTVVAGKGSTARYMIG